MAFWTRNMERWIADALQNLGVFNFEIDNPVKDVWVIHTMGANQMLVEALQDELMPHFSGNGYYEPYVDLGYDDLTELNIIEIFIGEAS